MKQARISALYLPLIDILIVNLPRLIGNFTLSSGGNSLNNPKHIHHHHHHQNQHTSSSNTSNVDSRITLASASTISNPNGQTNTYASSNYTNSSVSISASNSNSLSNQHQLNNNASIYVSNYPSQDVSSASSNNPASNPASQTTSSVLGVIAGIVNPKQILQDHLDSIIGPMSDTDSLSSADVDTHFKMAVNKRNSFSLVTASTSTSDTTTTTNTANTANSMLTSNNVPTNTSITTSNSNSAATERYCVMRKDKLESSEIKDLLICLVYILGHLSDDLLLGLLVNYDENEYADFLSLLEVCLKTFRYRGKANIKKLNVISKCQDVKTSAFVKSPDYRVNRNTHAISDSLEKSNGGTDEKHRGSVSFKHQSEFNHAHFRKSKTKRNKFYLKKC